MEIGMIGLGRMGSNMTRRLLDGGHRVVVYDPIREAIETLVAQQHICHDGYSQGRTCYTGGCSPVGTPDSPQ